MSMLDHWLDHRLPDDLRQRITTSTHGLAATPSSRTGFRPRFLALDWLVRTWLPTWLDLETSLPEKATELRKLVPIVDPVMAERAGPVVRDVRRQAEELWKQDEYRIWIFSGDTAIEILREAAEEAAADTGAVAFMAIAGSAAPNIANDAAYTGAYPAASAAAAAAARLGRGAEESNIRAAATAALAPTVRRLQESACDLYRAMVAEP